MKTIGKLKLNQLRKVELEKKEMTALKGGDSCSPGLCGCGCYYEGSPGGSSSNTNANWNRDEGYASPGCEGFCHCLEWEGYGVLFQFATTDIHAW